MGRRSRHTAKTGDAAIYKRRAISDDDNHDGHRKVRRSSGDYDENMYDEVDDYHNRREAEEEEFMKLDDGAADGGHLGGRHNKDEEEDNVDDGIVHNREAVFDLGIGASSSSSSSEEDDDDDSEDDSGDDNDASGRNKASATSSSSSEDEDSSTSTSDSSSDDDEMGGDESGNNAGTLDSVLDWGRNKRNYYHGDTADLEIGQQIEDAELEEEAGKEVQKARYEKMDEDDFLADFDVGKGKNKRGGESDDQEEVAAGRSATGTMLLSSGGGLGSMLFDDVERLSSTSRTSAADKRDKIANLSTEDKLRLLQKQSPELLPLISHFQSTTLAQLTEKIMPVMEQLSDGDQAETVGATDGGLTYLRQKQMVGVSTVLNLIVYLLLKLEQQQQQQQGEDGDVGLDIKSHPVIARLNALSELDEKLRTKIEEPFGLSGQLDALTKAAALMKEEGHGLDALSSSSSSESESESESRSIVRPGAEKSGEGTYASKLLASGAGNDSDRSTPSSSSSEDEDDSAAVERDAVNEARFAVRSHDFDDGTNRKAMASARGKRKTRRAEQPETMTTSVYDYGDEDVQAQDGLNASKKLSATMNAITQREKVSAGRRRAAPPGGDTENDIEGDDRLQRGLDMMEEMLGKASDDDEDVSDAELDSDDGGADEFYNTIKRRATAKKEQKKSIYQVAPKYPSLEEEIDGERGIGRTIMKNRGLVPHKSKLNRNPRVKKREQYRKALIRRKGAVREVRTDEVDTYGGEVTGIKSSISRSRKL